MTRPEQQPLRPRVILPPSTLQQQMQKQAAKEQAESTIAKAQQAEYVTMLLTTVVKLYGPFSVPELPYEGTIERGDGFAVIVSKEEGVQPTLSFRSKAEMEAQAKQAAESKPKIVLPGEAP